jgi:hypothetical protein
MDIVRKVLLDVLQASLLENSMKNITRKRLSIALGKSSRNEVDSSFESARPTYEYKRLSLKWELMSQQALALLLCHAGQHPKQAQITQQPA